MLRNALLGPRRHQLILGIVHFSVGMIMTAVLYVTRFDFGTFFRHANLTLDMSVFLFGFVKGTYGIGSVFPGQTLVLIAILGLACNLSGLGMPVFFVWAGVLLGLLLSYLLGVAAASIQGPQGITTPAGFSWKELIFAVTPTAASTYFFNMGYWKRAIHIRLFWYGVVGGLVLILLASAMCVLKALLAPRVDTLSLIYSAGLALYGLATIGYVVWRAQSGTH